MDAEPADEGLPGGGPAELDSLPGQGDGDQAGAEAVVVFQRLGCGVEGMRVSAGVVGDVEGDGLGGPGGGGAVVLEQVADFGELAGQLLSFAVMDGGGGDEQGCGLPGEVGLAGEVTASVC